MELENLDQVRDLLKSEGHQLVLIKQAQTGRCSDGSWYSTGTIYWCRGCGTLIYLMQKYPYDSTQVLNFSIPENMGDCV